MAIPPLVLRIVADSTGVKAGVAQTQKQVGGLKNSIVKNAGAIKLALAAAVVGGIAASVKAASDQVEAQNKANVVFGQSVAAVNAFADTSATGFGISKAAALEAAGGYGAMFQSAGLAEQASADMSVTMLGLASDMASFNNQDPTEMLDKLRAGLAGQSRPLRTFGVFLSKARVDLEATAMGMEKVGADFTDAQKIQARYNIILKDTKKQQGDFARTLGESLPSQMRKLKAQITDLAAKLGKTLIPVLLDLADTLNGLVGPLSDAFEGLQKFGAAMPGWGQKVAEGFGSIVAPGKSALGIINPFLGALQKLGVIDFSHQAPVLTSLINNIDAGFHKAATSMQDARLRASQFRTVIAHTSVATSRFSDVSKKDFREWATSAGANFDAVQTAMDNLADKAHLTANKVIHEFNRQATNIANYRDNLQTVAARNIPDALLQQLIDMGVGGANQLALLAHASDSQFAKMVAAMGRARRQGQGLSNDISNLRDNAKSPIVFNVHFQQSGIGDPRRRQHGGPVSAMRPYIVGEQGPELFVPSASGTIVPNNQLAAAGGGDITIPIYLGDEMLEKVVVKGFNRAVARA